MRLSSVKMKRYRSSLYFCDSPFLVILFVVTHCLLQSLGQTVELATTSVGLSLDNDTLSSTTSSSTTATTTTTIPAIVGPTTATSEPLQLSTSTSYSESQSTMSTTQTSPTTTTAFVVPIVLEFYSMFPTKGPVDGGTLVTFNASIPSQIYPTQIQLRRPSSSTVETSANITKFDREALMFTVSMPPVSVSLSGIPLTVDVRLNDSTVNSTGFNFTFWIGPNVTSIRPHQYIYTGGIFLTVEGSGFDIVVQPIININTTSKLSNGQINKAHYARSCQASNSTVMTCLLPTIPLPAAIAAHMKQLDDGIVVNGTTSYDEVDNILYGNRTIVDDGQGNTMRTDVGFRFDGNVGYSNLSRVLPSETLVLVPPPFIAFTSQPFTYNKMSTNVQFNVSGRHLDLGCEKSHYTVHFETISLSVDQLTRSSLTFIVPAPNTVSRNSTRFNFPCDDRSYHLQVQFVDIVYNVGCATPHSPCVSNPCQNGATCGDSADSYICTCTVDYYGPRCQKKYPTILSVSPTHGPAAGGTLVSIAMIVPVEFEPLGIYIGDSEFMPLVDRVSGNITVSTVSAIQPAADLAVFVKFWFNESTELNRSANNNFTFRQNPNITNIFPYQHLYTGGTILYIEGTDIDASVSPSIRLEMIATYVDSGIIAATVTSVGRCNSPSSELMSCPIPILDIPDDIVPQLDTDDYVPSPPFGDTPPAVDNNTDCSFYPFYNSITDQQVTSGSRYTSQFTVGFQFDGYLDYESFSALDVYAPPKLCVNQKLTWEARINHTVQIEGRHLLRGCVAADYKVFVEDTLCTAVALSNDTLSFLPRNVTTSSSVDCSPGFEYRIKVYVGYYEYYIGCIHYNYTADNHCKYLVCLNNGTCENTIYGARCNCVGTGFYGTTCQIREPQLNNMSPSFGPLQGSTVVNITGLVYDDSSTVRPTFVQFGNLSAVPAMYSTSNLLTVLTPNASNVGPVDVVIQYSDYHTATVVYQFNYRPNPNITAITPRQQNRKDSTRLTIIGTDLDVAQLPNMTVLTVVQRNNGLSVVTVTTPTPTNNCSTSNETSSSNGTTMICLMPVVQVPDDFVDQLNQQNLTTAMQSNGGQRQRRATDGASSWLWSVFNGRRTARSGRRRRDLGITLDNGDSMTVYMTFQFDGYVIPQSDKLAILLRNPPTFTDPGKPIAVYPNITEQIIEIQGINLLLGCSPEDYRVFVDDVECQVFKVEDQQLQFYRPVTFVTSNRTFSWTCKADQDGDTTYHIEILLGSTSYPAGCIEYVDVVEVKQLHDELLQRLLYYVGASVGAAIVIVIVIGCFTRSSSHK